MIRTKKIAILAIVIMLLTLIPGALFAATADSDRLSGDNRIATALDIASAGWTTAGAVVLAPADTDNLVDALAAAPLAGQENAPILLTYKGSLDASVKAKIAALGATKVYVIGAISEAVAAEVDAIANVTVETLKGANRLATAAAVNAKLTAPAGTFVVGFDAIPDALSVASFAAKNKYAIVLANADGSVNAASLVGATKYIVGGTALVNDIAGVERIAGADRFATNAAVAGKLGFSYDRVYVANGVSLVDALAVAPLAAKYGAFVALASGSDVYASSVVNAKLTASSKVVAVGGAGAVADVVKGKVGFVVPAVLAVQSVSAVNLKQIEVKFNKEMNKDFANNEALYSLDGSALSTVNDLAELQSDKKTVLITLNTALTNDTEKSFIVGKVKATDGEELGTSYTTKVKYTDTIVPTVTSVEVTEKRTLLVKFNEPVWNGDTTLTATDFVVDSGSYVVSTATAKLNKKAVELALGSDLAAGTHTVKVKAGNIKDFADYKLIEQTVTFTYGADTAAPTVSVKSATEKTITLAFSESVINVNDANVRFRHTYDNSSYQVLGNTGAAVVADTDDKEWKITFASPMAPGTVKLYIGYATDNSSSTKIADKFGNKLEKLTLDVTVTEDKTAPTVTSVAFVDSTHIDVTFSEKVTGADVVSNYTLKDADDKTVTISAAVNQTGNTYRLTTATMNGGSYKLTVGGNIEDTSLATNDLVPVTLNVPVNDKVDPTVTAVVTNKAAGTNADKLRVYFSEAMADEGLTAKSSYYLKVDGGAAAELPTGTTITKINSKTVEIVFPSAMASLNADGDVLAVSGQLKDLAGNDIGGLVSDVTIGVDTVAVVADSAKALDKRTVEFRVNKMVKAVNAAGFDETAGALNIATVTAANDVAKGEGIITVKFDTDMATNVTGIAFTIAVLDTGIQTELGYSGTTIASAVTEATAKDYIKPELSTVVTADADADGQIDQMIVTYTENIQQTSVSISDYTVEGYTVKDVAVANNVVTVKLTESGVYDATKTPKLTQVGEVADDSAQHNVLGAQAAKTATDGAAPLVAVVGKLTVLATSVAGAAGAVEAGATVKIVADGASSGAAAAGSGAVTAAADGSFAAITGLTTGVAYDVYVIDAAGNVSAKLDITTP
jgi:putative cell wall-binding protein